jgi:hypothetical protein
MMMGQATPYLEAFSMARAAAASVFVVIDRESKIDSLSEGGMKPSSLARRGADSQRAGPENPQGRDGGTRGRLWLRKVNVPATSAAILRPRKRTGAVDYILCVFLFFKIKIIMN